MIQLANQFISNGHNVRFYVIDDKGPNREELNSSIPRLELNSNKHKNKLLKFICNILKSISLLKKNKGSYIFSTIKELNCIVLLAAVLTNSSDRVCIREANSITKIKRSRKAKERVFYYLMKLLYRRAGSVVALNSDMKKEIEEHFNVDSGKVSIINNPINQKVIQKKNKLKKNNNDRYIISSGRLTKVKNHIDLIEAFPIVSRKINDLKLVILGEGEELGRLQKKTSELNLEDKVRFIGFQKNPYGYYSNALLLVHTSCYEGSPNVISEAIALNTPVIAYDIGGSVREILSDGKFGQLVQFKNKDKLANAIIKLIETKFTICESDIRDFIKERNIESVSAHYLSSLLRSDKKVLH